MRPDLVVPPKITPGARVAVLSPAFAAPGLFPERHELSLQRLRDEIGVEPIEFPTTRQLGASPQARAADVMAAFGDPSIAAIMSSIGGDDELTVLPYLDPEVARANPKAFFGYSDNTNLLNWLWGLGIASYHGGSTTVHLGRAVRTLPISRDSLTHALFDRADIEVDAATEFGEDEIDWKSPESRTTEPTLQPAHGVSWHGPQRVVTAPTWGGNLEILHWNLAAGRWIRPVEDYAGCILLLETSEEMPSGEDVFRMLRNAGERGLLHQFPAVLMARPRASNFDEVRDAAARVAYREQQRDAVIRAFTTYHPDAMIVFDVDFGHTEPQWVLPYGGTMTVDGLTRRIVAHY